MGHYLLSCGTEVGVAVADVMVCEILHAWQACKGSSWEGGSAERGTEVVEEEEEEEHIPLADKELPTRKTENDPMWVTPHGGSLETTTLVAGADHGSLPSAEDRCDEWEIGTDDSKQTENWASFHNAFQECHGVRTNLA